MWDPCGIDYGCGLAYFQIEPIRGVGSSYILKITYIQNFGQTGNNASAILREKLSNYNLTSYIYMVSTYVFGASALTIHLINVFMCHKIT
jgi:hypothetical protein